MEVDLVGVPRQVGDLPDLGFARVWRLGRRVHVGAPEAAILHPLVCPQQLEQAAVSIKGLVEGQLPDLHARRQVQLAVLNCRAWRHEELVEVRRQIGFLGDAQRRVLAGRGDDLEPHDLPGVRPEAGGRRGGIWGVREVVIDRVAHRERRGGVVVEDNLLPVEPTEVDEQVPALRRGGDEAATERVGIERLVRVDMHRFGQEAAVRPEHEEVGAWLIGWLHRVAGEGDAVRTSIIHVQLQVEESSLASVEDAQAIAPGLDPGRLGIHRAVGEHRVAEHLGDNRGVGKRAQQLGSQLPAVLLVGVRVPQAAHRGGEGPGGIVGGDVGPDEDLVVDDDGDLASPVLHKVGQALVAQVGLEAITDDVGAGDPCVGIEPCEIVGVVVVPDQPSALVVGVVVLCLAFLEVRVEPLVDVALFTLDTRAVLAIRGKPGERAAVADPGCEPTVQVGGGRVLALLRVREVIAGVDRQDMLRW